MVLKTALSFLLMLQFLPTSLWARDVIDTANRLSQAMTKFGMAISVGGLVICGLYFVFGKQDASTKLINCLIGMVCIWGTQTLISFISSIA